MKELEHGALVEFTIAGTEQRASGKVRRLLPAKWRRGGTEESYEVYDTSGRRHYVLRERMLSVSAPIDPAEFVEEGI